MYSTQENKSTDTMQKSIIDFCSILCLYQVQFEHLCAEKNIHDVESVAITELQQIPSVLVQTRNSMSSNHTLPCFHIFSNVCVEIPVRTVDSECDTLSRVSFTLSTKA